MPGGVPAPQQYPDGLDLPTVGGGVDPFDPLGPMYRNEQGLPLVRDDEDFKQLPPGSEFMSPPGPDGSPGQKRKKPGLPLVRNDDDYKKLPPGSEFMSPPGPDGSPGQKRKKPGPPIYTPGPAPGNLTQEPQQQSSSANANIENAIFNPEREAEINEEEIAQAEQIQRTNKEAKDIYNENKPENLPKGIRWNPFRNMPVDSKGRGPTHVIATLPPIWVMADGTEITGKRPMQQGNMEMPLARGEETREALLKKYFDSSEKLKGNVQAY